MTVAARRRYIVRACKRRGWVLEPKALQNMMDYVHSEQALEDILDALEGRISSGKTVTAEIWEEFLSAEQEREEALQTTTRSKRKDATASVWTDDVQIIDAFATPKLVYDVTRKQFHLKETQESLFGSPSDKTNMLAQRYALIHQRLLRHDLFRPSQLGHDARASAVQHQLTPIESLLGKKALSKTFLLLGVLIQIDEGNYFLEDPTGQIPVSFQEATAVDDFFVTEHCILLVEGSFHDGIFYIQRVGHPLLETRDVSLAALRQQLSHPLYAKPTDDETQDPVFVILADVHLDQPRVIQQLESLFATYEKYPPTQLPLFVLMGNFSSNARESPPMEELAAVLSAFANLSKHAHFVLVPGPNDTSQHVLPFSPLTARLARVANVHMATNPSRISYRGREMVLFCYNTLHMLQRKQIMLPQAESMSDEMDLDMDLQSKQHHRLIKTLLDQAHLVPVQGVPVFWNYDHALRLYPLPDALILGGDAVSDCFHEIYGGCHVMHAGSMGANGSYAVFRLNDEGENGADDSMDSLEGKSGSGSVVFAKFGNIID